MGIVYNPLKNSSVKEEENSISKENGKRIIAIICIVIIATPILLQINSLVSNDLTNAVVEDDGNSHIEIQEYQGEIVRAENGGTWIPFSPGAGEGTPQIILPKTSTTTSMLIDTSFSGAYNISVEIDETWYNYLHMPNVGTLGEVGMPSVPILTRYFIVPENVDLEIDIEYALGSVLDGFRLAPSQEPIPNLKDYDPPPFELHNETYMTDEFYPSEIVTAEGLSESSPMYMRGYRFIPITFYPLQFNPVTHQIRIFSKIEVRIIYSEAAQIEMVPFRLCSSAFFKIFDALFPNFGSISETEDCPSGAEYLIITNDTFYDAVVPLAEWKTQKGIKATIVKTSEINPSGPTANEIRDYIMNAYNTWTPAPSYVLLVGDVEHLPTNYGLPHPYDRHGGFHIATDLYYGTVHGNDTFPDVFVGRLPVDTYIECVNLTYKIINYERNPDPNPFFYNSTIVAGEFQDNDGDGFEDRRFILTCEEIRDFLLDEGNGVTRIYHHDNPAANNPTNYNLGNYGIGDPLPADLLWNGFRWNGDTSHVVGNISLGSFLVVHRDHGSSQNYWSHLGGYFPSTYDGWTSPRFTTADVGALTNSLMWPVVFNIECMGGWFDGETDQTDDPALTNNFESLCEELLVAPATGAIATIGASRVSYSGVNDDLAEGFIDAIWPDFNVDFNSGGLYSFGQIMTYGKAYMATRDFWTGNTLVDETFELFNLFGDPELELWTDYPETLDVTHPSTIGSQGLQSFVVKVNDASLAPVNHARVCLWKASDIYEVEYTDALGCAYFEITPASSGDLLITVTKHNFIPYESIISVTGSGATISVTPEQGPDGINVQIMGTGFDGSETVSIYFGGPSVDTTTSASSGSFTIPTFAVPAGDDGPLNVYALGQTSGRAALTLFRRLPDTPLPDPYLYCQWDSSTWHLNPAGGDPRWNNPVIQLYDQATMNPVASNDLEIGHLYVIEATIHNDATVDAVDTSVTFEWAFWGAGQKTWHLIETDVVTVPAGSQVSTDAEWTPSVTGHTCLMISITHATDSDLDNNKGQENTHVHPVSSPGEVNFMVENPSGAVGTPFLSVRQVGNPNFTIWENTIGRETQILGPGANQTVTLGFNAPDIATVGEFREVVVDVFLYDVLIGGIEVVIEKVEPTVITNTSTTTTTTTTNTSLTTSTVPNGSTSTSTMSTTITNTSPTTPEPTTPDWTLVIIVGVVFFAVVVIAVVLLRRR